jgi:6-phospho-beta-glucosidase
MLARLIGGSPTGQAARAFARSRPVTPADGSPQPPFPEDFLWAAATAAYQVEGAAAADGKGPSLWDAFAHEPGRTFRASNGDVAADHYHRFREDVALMAEIGLTGYRFSVAWSRVLPEGRGRANEAGLRFYDELIDALLTAGITPILTIYHWDLPQALQDAYGGWESREVIADFDAYCRLLYARYGDRVRHWVSLNEQNYFIGLGYERGAHPPGVTDLARMQVANHHASLANATATASFRDLVPDGLIGPSFAYTPVYPASPDPQDALAAEEAEEHLSHWWMDVYAWGRYPEATWRYLAGRGAAPPVRPGDLDVLAAGVPDFMGVNYYQTYTVTSNPTDGLDGQRMNTSGAKGAGWEVGVAGRFRTITNPQVSYTDWDWAIDPNGLRIALRRIASRYGLPVLVSENGLGAFDDVVVDPRTGERSVHDRERIGYLGDHLRACGQAITDGVELLGFCVWSAIDVLSWLNGYQKRYGLIHVERDESTGETGDRGPLTRTIKASGRWYGQVIASGGVALEELTLPASAGG